MADTKATTAGQAGRTRRALLGGVVAGGAAIAMRSVGGADRALAANSPLLIGTTNDSTAETGLQRTDVDVNIAMCGNDYGLIARPHVVNSIGLLGAADKPGGTGVIGQTSGDSTQVAVLADTSDGSGEGYAVKAITKNGSALYGEAVGGYALEAQGVTNFSRAGMITISQGRASKTLTLTGHGNYITAQSFVVATIQGDVAGTWVRACSVNQSANSFTIRLNKAAPKSLSVGWFVIN